MYLLNFFIERIKKCLNTRRQVVILDEMVVFINKLGHGAEKNQTLQLCQTILGCRQQQNLVIRGNQLNEHLIVSGN